jgi:hypothetical protein
MARHAVRGSGSGPAHGEEFHDIEPAAVGALSDRFRRAVAAAGLALEMLALLSGAPKAARADNVILKGNVTISGVAVEDAGKYWKLTGPDGKVVALPQKGDVDRIVSGESEKPQSPWSSRTSLPNGGQIRSRHGRVLLDDGQEVTVHGVKLVVNQPVDLPGGCVISAPAGKDVEVGLPSGSVVKWANGSVRLRRPETRTIKPGQTAQLPHERTINRITPDGFVVVGMPTEYPYSEQAYRIRLPAGSAIDLGYGGTVEAKGAVTLLEPAAKAAPAETAPPETAPASAVDSGMAPKARGGTELSGYWSVESPRYRFFRLDQEGDNVSGRFEMTDKNGIGKLTGKIVDSGADLEWTFNDGKHSYNGKAKLVREKTASGDRWAYQRGDDSEKTKWFEHLAAHPPKPENNSESTEQ